MKLSSYNKINIIFLLIILLVIFYSAIYTADEGNHFIKSACTVKPCASTGLSRAFSEIIRLNFESALTFNRNSLSVFLFFAIQFLLRILAIILINKQVVKINRLIIMDSTVSIILYIITFRGIIFNI